MNVRADIVFEQRADVASVPFSQTPSPLHVIHESPHVRVIHRPRPCDAVVVTFNEIGRCVDGLSFWGEEVLRREGVAAIGVVSTRPNWFPRDGAMIDAIRTTIANHGYRWVVTYGHSQGGYGALKYAGALSAQTAIAFCPQWSIAPADVAGADSRFVGYYQAELHDGMRIEQGDAECDAFICFDPRSREDSWHAARITERVACAPVLTPFSGHSGIRFATRAGIGQPMLRTLMDPTESVIIRAARARHLVRSARGRSADYWLGRAEALFASSGRAREVARSLSEASRRGEDEPELLAGIAALHLVRSETAQALEHARRASAIVDPAAVHTVLRIWDVMDRTGHGSLSLPLLREAVARSPANSFLRLHLVKTLLDARAAASLEAAREVGLAAANAGSSVMLWRHIENACRILGQADGLDSARRNLARLTDNDGEQAAES